MSKEIKIGDRVFSKKLPQDSNYKTVIGVVKEIRNGFLIIDVESASNSKNNTLNPVENLTLGVRAEDAEIYPGFDL